MASRRKAIWEEFIRHIRPKRKESIQRMQVARAACAPDPVRRRFERHKAELPLVVDSVGELQTLLATNVSQGGMFVATTVPLPIGHSMRVIVVHPNSGATFLLDCVVRRRDVDGSPPGVGVEFDAMSDAHRADFMEFIKDELPVLSESEEDVDESEVDQWEEEEPTNVRPEPARGRRS
jgi:PilZ domain